MNEWPLQETPPMYGGPNKEVELMAMEAVMEFERTQGFDHVMSQRRIAATTWNHAIQKAT